MLKHPRLTESRIVNTLERLRGMIYGPTAPLTIESRQIEGEPIDLERALQGQFAPASVGGRWGKLWGTTWFRFSGEIPAAWKGREVAALIRLGGRGVEGFSVEGLVWQEGKPTRALNTNRADVPLARKAAGGERVLFHVEAAANPNAHEFHYDLLKAEAAVPSFILEQAELACFNPEAFQLYNDFRVAADAMLALPEDGPRRGQLLYALNAAVNLLDPDDAATLQPARDALAPVFASRNAGSAHRMSAIGHAHIDTAWLWPLRETIRKCARTFSTALAYMEEYPEYVFGCSQPQQYAWMKAWYPAIFAGIKAAISRGQWEAMGSMWIEADCNLSSGEALIRQILHGKNFFLDEFGIETRDIWLPDVFGYSAAMPQIMRKSGLTQFLTQKISWNQTNKFPHHTFLWEGLDGTRVFSHFPPADTYNATFTAKELVFSAKNFREHDRASRSLYVYGFGDGGGGPTKEMLETARRVRDFDGLPRVELEKVEQFFAKAKADAKDLPVWVGELYLELHRGTYTTQARNKRENRKGEFLLRDAEFFEVMAAAHGAAASPAPRTPPEHAVYDVTGRDGGTDNATYLERAWKLLLLNQFHDIIPGSSINWVYRDSDRDYETIRTLGAAVRDDSLRALAGRIDTSGFARPLVVFNTLSHARREIVSLPDGAPARVEVPACGYTVIEAGGGDVSAGGDAITVRREGDRIRIDNGLLRIDVDRDGCLAGVFDHRAGREVLAPGARGNVFQLHRDEPADWDAWDVDVFYKESCEDLTAAESVEIVEEAPLRVQVRIERAFGKSRLWQNLVVRAGSARIEFETGVDWQERHKLLKAAFPVNVRSPRATYEIQYGHVERPTHYNTSWDLARFEVCAQKWADLSEEDYGVALLNDCKYGHDIFGNVMRLSLLRAPTSPDPEADRGSHRFTYALLPHPEGFRKGRVIEEAYELNVPLVFAPAGPNAQAGQAELLPGSRSFFTVDRPGVIIEAIKKAEKEEAVIVRLYEAYGTRGPVSVQTTLPFKHAFTADLMERTLEPVAFAGGRLDFDIAPFEIVTLKFS